MATWGAAHRPMLAAEVMAWIYPTSGWVMVAVVATGLPVAMACRRKAVAGVVILPPGCWYWAVAVVLPPDARVMAVRAAPEVGFC